jgi:hypothetical protein
MDEDLRGKKQSPSVAREPAALNKAILIHSNEPQSALCGHSAA